MALLYFYSSPHNIPEVVTRGNLYGITGTPTAVFDGYDRYIGGSGSTMYDRYVPYVEDHLAIPSPLALSLEMSINGSSGSVSGMAEVTEALPAGTYGVYIAVYEEHAPVEPNLVRDFAVFNEALTITAVGATQEFSGTFNVDAAWDADNLQALIFVQDMEGDLEILQAGTEALDPGATLIVTGPGEGPLNVTDVHGYLPDQTGSPELSIGAYGVDRYGVNVAVGDIDGDMADEIITGPGPGAVFGPHVRGFESDGTQTTGVSFFAYGTPRWGVNVSAGDIDADGYAEIVTGAGPGKVFGPHVRAFNYDASGSVTPVGGVSYFAYGTWKYGVNVACGDIDGDGYDEIVTGAGPGAVFGPHVRGWNHDGSGIAAMSSVSYLAYGTNKFGVNVACGDIDGDGYDEIITGAGPGAVFSPHVRGWNVDGGAAASIPQVNFFAFDYSQYGVNVGAGDVDGDGIDEILTGAGPNPGIGALVRVYNYDGSDTTMTIDFEAYNGDTVTHGVNVAAGSF